jgi:phosphopantetheinyl transferase
MLEKRKIDSMIVILLEEWKRIGVDLELEILKKFHKLSSSMA